MTKSNLQKALLAAFFLPLVLWNTAQAQDSRTITGRVTASDTKETLPGANVVVKGTTRGTSTDMDGLFSLKINAGDNVLLVTFAGYQTQEVEIGTQTYLDIELKVISTLMDEVVVIGYGAVRKRDLTGAVGTIKPKEITKFTALNAEQALQGKVAGVQITTTSGAPGAGAAVRIRGVGTFNNAAPIYVVDGVILDDISFLNAADIASMEVLKDASATAIYGSRGANGVIMISTKTGKIGQERTTVSWSSESGIQRLENYIDLLDGRQFATISNEIRAGSYNNVDAVPNTDWQRLVFDIAPIQTHQLSISGAGQASEYYISLGIFDQSGIISPSRFQRITLKLNNTYYVRPNIKFGNNLTLAPYQRRNAPDVTFSVYRAQPVARPFYDDGSYGVVQNVGNPLADLEYNSNNYGEGVRAVGNIFAEATFWNNFIAKSSFGVDASINRGRNFSPAYTVFNPDGTASQQQNVYSDISKSVGTNGTWLWENTLSFNKTAGKHNINGVTGFTMQKTRSENLGMAGQNVLRDGRDFWYVEPAYILDQTNNINMVNSIFNNVDAGQFYNMMSFLLRSSYTYDERYLATVTLRRDGSSKFAENNRWGTFPSFALGWNINKEQFMRRFTWLSDMKVRASWGKIGNEKISYFDRFARVNQGLNAVFGNPDVGIPAATYDKTGNPDLRWETTTQTDIGLEAGFFKGKLTAEIDYYNRVTDDILVDLSTPGHLGNGQGVRVRYNAASVQNKGFETSIRWQEKRGEFGYGLGFIGTTVRNEVLAIGGNSGIDSVLVGGYLANGMPVTLTRIGGPIGAFYGYVTDGIFQNEAELNAYPRLGQAGVGDLRFKDINGDGRIDGNDRTMIGSPIPNFIFGFNIDMDWRGFDLAVALQGQTGNEIFNGKNVVRPDPYNFEAHVWNRWQGEGTSNTEPRPSFGGYNFLPSDRFIHDGSFLRIRSVVLGYTIPEKRLRKLAIQTARVYVKGNNLLTFTKYTGYTPEIGSFDVLSNGIDTGIYPIPAIYSFGVNLTF
jgi:TonB-linked SusC/RagA family outer membrane protein